MRWSEFNLIVEVGDGAGDLENSMISARGKAESFGGGLEKCSRIGVHGGVGIEPAADRVGVAGDSCFFREAFPLCCAGALDARANGAR